MLRQGRLTKAQGRAIEQHWREFGVEHTKAPLDLDAIFQRTAPRMLDIGSGMGEVVLALAKAHPENDYLAVEVHRPGIGRLLGMIAEHGISNIRIIHQDIVNVIDGQIPDQSLSAVYIHFPDPWPKRRHHKRRLVNAPFIRQLALKMRLGARLYLATDCQGLAEYMLAVCNEEPSLLNCAGSRGFSPRPAWRPVSRFERRGLRLEHGIRELIYDKIP